MNEIITLRGSPFSEMFKMLHQGTEFTSDVIRSSRTLSIYLLTISFLLFFLILSITYINPSVYITCQESDKLRENVFEIPYKHSTPNLAIEAYSGIISVTDSKFSFLPDVNDIEIIDESSEAIVPPSVPEADTEISETSDREALTAVKMALKFKQMNNLDKARKLFQHAIALSPNHHDVLLHYGEFLESGNDFINADHFYLKALMLRPKDSRALVNRKRVLPVVNQLDLEVLNRIDSKRSELISMNTKDPTLKRLKKEIYFQHIYHTVAIEGNTMTLDETRTIVETRMAVSGKSIMEHNEILGVENAFRYINQTLVNKDDITVKDILEIHRRVLGHVDPMVAGTFRTTQVFVGQHTPPPADEVEGLMDELVALLQAPHVKNMHPTQVAAFAHHKLVYIHPFLDGNGRTARLLMNLIFLKYGYPPILIKKEQRGQYYKLLQIANEGDIRPFYRFIACATECTIDAFLLASKNLRRRALESSSNVKDVIPLGS